MITSCAGWAVGHFQGIGGDTIDNLRNNKLIDSTLSWMDSIPFSFVVGTLFLLKKK